MNKHVSNSFEFYSFSEMFSMIHNMLGYPFITKAIFIGAIISLCSSLLGVSLVLKRYSMIGDGLSHVGFGALAVATAMNVAPLKVSIPVVMAAAFCLLRINSKKSVNGDAAIALISTSSLAIGVITVSITSGMNTDVCNYMFGSILAMSDSDVKMSIVLSIIVLVLFVVFYNKIFAVTFDENFAKATGVKAQLYNTLIAVLISLTIVLGMRLMGALLISSLIIFPSLTSMRIFSRFKSVVICSALLSVICFIVGISGSYIYEIPAGASVVAVNLITFILFTIVAKMKKQFK